MLFKTKGFQLCLAFALGIVVLLLPRPDGSKFRITGDGDRALLQHVDRHFTLISEGADRTKGYALEAKNPGSREGSGVFLASKVKELKMMALLHKIADKGDGEGWQWGQLRLHLIKSDLLATLGASSKLNAEWEFLTMLRDEGRRAADEFVRLHRKDIGVRSTLDLDSLLEGV